MTFPTHCFSCGALLLAGWTKHKHGCAVLRMIKEVLRDASK